MISISSTYSFNNITFNKFYIDDSFKDNIGILNRIYLVNYGTLLDNNSKEYEEYKTYRSSLQEFDSYLEENQYFINSNLSTEELIYNIDNLLNNPSKIHNSLYFSLFDFDYIKALKYEMKKILSGDHSSVFYLNTIKEIDIREKKYIIQEIHKFVIKKEVMPFYIDLFKKYLMLNE